MKSEIVNKDEKYFMGSFGYKKCKPEDFGLKEVDAATIFMDKDGVLWRNEILWDSGWGNEYVFMRLPELNFNQLWILLTESTVELNIKGSAELLREYPNEVKQELQKIFTANESISLDLTKRLSNLELLNYVINHSEMKGKTPTEVDADYQEWKKLKEDFDRLIKNCP